MRKLLVEIFVAARGDMFQVSGCGRHCVFVVDHCDGEEGME